MDDNTHTPNRALFHVNQCYMFITILEVLTDRNKTKAYKLSLTPNSYPTNNSFYFLLYKLRATDHKTTRKLNQTIAAPASHNTTIRGETASSPPQKQSKISQNQARFNMKSNTVKPIFGRLRYHLG